jgi:hypothetical protein
MEHEPGGRRTGADDDTATGGAAPVAGWFADPAGRSHARWHDGTAWTVTVAAAGRAVLDPHGLRGIAPDAPRFAVAASRPARSVDRRDAREAKRATRDARRAYERTVAAADRAVLDAERRRDRALRIERARLEAAADPRGALVGAYRGIVLYERVIVTPDGVDTSVRGATATVDTAGSSAVTHRPTLTRAAAGGLLFGPIGVLGSLAARKREVVDSRELYVVVETEAGGIVLRCPADDGLVARQFALAVSTVARRLDDRDRRAVDVARDARASIARLSADPEVEEARARAARVRRAPGLPGPPTAADRALAARGAGPGPTSDGDSGPPALPG